MVPPQPNACPHAFFDDFSDGRYSGRGISTSEPNCALPEWSLVPNQAASSTWTAVDGTLTSTFEGSQGLGATSTTAYGTFEWDHRFLSETTGIPVAAIMGFIGSSTMLSHIGPGIDVPDDSYLMVWGALFGGSVGLLKISSGVPSTLAFAPFITSTDTDTHSFKVVRSSSGNLDLYIDGAFKFSVVDNSITTSQKVYVYNINAGSSSTVNSSFDNIRVTV